MVGQGDILNQRDMCLQGKKYLDDMSRRGMKAIDLLIGLQNLMIRQDGLKSPFKGMEVQGGKCPRMEREAYSFCGRDGFFRKYGMIYLFYAGCLTRNGWLCRFENSIILPWFIDIILTSYLGIRLDAIFFLFLYLSLQLRPQLNNVESRSFSPNSAPFSLPHNTSNYKSLCRSHYHLTRNQGNIYFL